MNFLNIQNLSYFFQDGDSQRYILDDISATFEKGTFYTILGESGSGKTTLLSLLAALDKPQAGEILIEGKDISSIGFESFRRNKTGIIFQSYNLICYMTAVENVLVAMSITQNELPPNHKEVAYNLLDYIGISKEKADRTVNKLSGGEQQRVAIARALATNVDLILADEPTGNLNEEMEAEIVEIFKKLAHQHNKCVIVVTHSVVIAAQSDVCFRLNKGKIEHVQFASPEAAQTQQPFGAVPPQSPEYAPQFAQAPPVQQAYGEQTQFDPMQAAQAVQAQQAPAQQVPIQQAQPVQQPMPAAAPPIQQAAPVAPVPEQAQDPQLAPIEPPQPPGQLS